MIIKVAHECNIDSIKYVQQNTEFDFAIAHYALESPQYAELYRLRPKGRILILDNGKFELETPLEAGKVVEAARTVKADYVVAPDFYGDPTQTTLAARSFVKECAGFKIAVVIVGKTAEALVDCYKVFHPNGEAEVKPIGMYCWSFLYPRAKALSLLEALDTTRPHHLLGFDTISELKETLWQLKRLGVNEVTLDTRKPVSAAFRGEILKDIGRGGYQRFTIDDYVSPTLLAYNMGVFRGWVDNLEGVD